MRKRKQAITLRKLVPLLVAAGCDVRQGKGSHLLISRAHPRTGKFGRVVVHGSRMGREVSKGTLGDLRKRLGLSDRDLGLES